jgi:uncharacterized protein with GYD domain
MFAGKTCAPQPRLGWSGDTDSWRWGMPRYLFEASYTLEGVQGIQSGGGTARRDAIAAAAESVGGKLVSLDFAFGDRDAIAIVDLPDNQAAVALTLAVNASGRVNSRTVVLLTPEEVDAAVGRSVAYRPPGE